MAQAAVESLHYALDDSYPLSRSAYREIQDAGGPQTPAQAAVAAFVEDDGEDTSQATCDALNAAVESLNLWKPGWVDGQTMRTERIMPDRVEVVDTARQAVRVERITPDRDEVDVSLARLAALDEAVDHARDAFWRANDAEFASRGDSVNGSGVRFNRDAQMRRDAARDAWERAIAARDAASSPKV